jgi:hypothetical protein
MRLGPTGPIWRQPQSERGVTGGFLASDRLCFAIIRGFRKCGCWIEQYVPSRVTLPLLPWQLCERNSLSVNDSQDCISGGREVVGALMID